VSLARWPNRRDVIEGSSELPHWDSQNSRGIEGGKNSLDVIDAISLSHSSPSNLLGHPARGRR
jgi:hypothetical protein